MAQESVKLLIPFDSLVDSVTELSLEEKRRLWEVLDEQIALTEEEMWEQTPTVQAEIREARAAYQAGDYVTVEELAFEELEQQITRLPPQEQLKLVAHISERLSAMPVAPLAKVDEESARRQREKEADELLALCDEAAEMWEGTFDAAEEIRQMRRDRDEQIWLSR
ncbi:MAG: hypothetical protein A2Z04_07410 [Chloroflexi bacterium RBG_16_57_9]|nr:MAG: hypothetical protein A2Z04_07410 [Chloroflexi bacterium RBG_16_57_9]